jgi:hypothetical protein
MPQKQKFTDQQFLNLYNENLNDPQIAKILNVSRNVVKKRRYRLELMPKKQQSNSNPTLSHEKLKEEYKRYKIKQILKNPNFYKEKNKAYKQKNPNYNHNYRKQNLDKVRKNEKKYANSPKGKIKKRKNDQKYYQKKLKENPNYNKEQYKKIKIKKLSKLN